MSVTVNDLVIYHYEKQPSDFIRRVSCFTTLMGMITV